MPQALKTEKDIAVSKTTTNYLTSFAQCGKPAPLTVTDNATDMPTWGKYGAEGQKNILMFEHDGKVVIKEDVDAQRNEFWNGVLKEVEFCTSTKKIERLHSKIAERRH